MRWTCNCAFLSWISFKQLYRKDFTLDLDSAPWHTTVLVLVFQSLHSSMFLSDIWSSFPLDDGGLLMKNPVRVCMKVSLILSRSTVRYLSSAFRTHSPLGFVGCPPVTKPLRVSTFTIGSMVHCSIPMSWMFWLCYFSWIFASNTR